MTTFTYIKDARDPRLNIRIATDREGFELVANVMAIGRYCNVSPNDIYFVEQDALFFRMSDGLILARLERVRVDIAFDRAAH